MKPLHWILIVLALAGAGVGVWWFKFRKPAASPLPAGSPYYTPPTAPQPQITAGKPASGSAKQSLSSTLQAKAGAVASAVVAKGLDKATSILGDKLSSLFD